MFLACCVDVFVKDLFMFRLKAKEKSLALKGSLLWHFNYKQSFGLHYVLIHFETSIGCLPSFSCSNSNNWMNGRHYQSECKPNKRPNTLGNQTGGRKCRQTLSASEAKGSLSNNGNIAKRKHQLNKDFIFNLWILREFRLAQFAHHCQK